MDQNINDKWYRKTLACPDCLSELSIDKDILCTSCGYQCALNRPISIKPKSAKPLTIIHSRLQAEHPSTSLSSMTLEPPAITYSGPEPLRDSKELLSAISAHLGKQSAVLDLGCGPRDQAAPLEHLGYNYVGIDYSNEKADMLADAHALPFKPASFDCVFSFAVLEHLHDPFVAINEIARVLKPGGFYVGTVSQGEPFHDSYFHHTAWGVLSVISSDSRLEVQKLWSSYDTLAALASMGRYPKVIKLLLKAVDVIDRVCPFLAPRRMKWSKQEKAINQIFRTGGIGFLVKKHDDV